jgi:hypothetical protein
MLHTCRRARFLALPEEEGTRRVVDAATGCQQTRHTRNPFGLLGLNNTVPQVQLCLCVCERARETERQRDRETET